MPETAVCWVCGGTSWRPFKESTLRGGISSDDFKITDARYGHTGRIEQCEVCGFKQVKDVESVLKFYESLEDVAYDEGREQRGLQARKIIEALLKYKKGGRLLDVGAASGILLEQAGKLGFDGEGVEPSRSLAKSAQDAGFKVHLGIFPHPAIKGSYDVITLIDVIEHVPNPIQLLKDIAAHLKPDGVGVLTTPDVQSLVARILGPRWWHFRVAHIGYFSRETMKRALAAAGLEILEMSSPAWYFTYEYACDRAMVYLPRFMRFKMPRALRERTIKVNFGDSMQVIFRRKS
jgi:2-polyprenyl-3-methyl-5-hydroxy-6-metoxy-1,4-benzoquinol methylase